jgi:hypothetical protein
MIKVSVEIHSGAACFRAAVCAQSIERAVSLVGARYPGCQAKILFPIEPDDYFVKGPISASGMVLSDAPEQEAG